MIVAGARRIELRFQVLETRVLAVVLCPFTVGYCTRFGFLRPGATPQMEYLGVICVKTVVKA